MGLDLTYCAPDALMATSQVPLTPPLVPRHLGPTRSLTELPIFCPKPDLRLSHTTGNDTAISLQKPEPRILFPPQTPPWTCKAAVPRSPPRGRAGLGVPLHWTPLQVPDVACLSLPTPRTSLHDGLGICVLSVWL